jgi:uncharacterized protein (TIGR00304 family)
MAEGSQEGLFLVILGISLIFLGIVYSAFEYGRQQAGSFTGVIFIGPFPVVFGEGPGYQYLLLLGVAILLLMVLLSYIFLRNLRYLESGKEL